MHWPLLAAAEAPGLYERLRLWIETLAASPAAVWSLFLFAFAESSFFPIPPDVLLMALCFTDAALESLALTLWFAAVCSIGSTLGGGFGYFLGIKAGRPILKRLVKQEKIDAAERLLRKYDVWAVAAAGFTPIPYKVFTIASGLLRVRFVRFIVASVASRSARFFLVAGLCHAFGPWVRAILEDYFAWATLAFFVLLFGSFWLIGHVAKRHGTGAADDAAAADGDKTEATAAQAGGAEADNVHRGT